MKITLSGYELEDALKAYFQLQFNKQVEITVDDTQEIVAHVTLGSVIDNSEPEETTTEEKPKQRRGRKPKVESEVNNDDIEDNVQVSTHYANLPELTKEEREKYVYILTLLNNNPLNKNKNAILDAIKELSNNLNTVLNANIYYKEWLENLTLDRIEEPVTEPDTVTEDRVEEEEEDDTFKNTLENIIDDIVTSKESQTQNKLLFSSTNNSNVTKSGTFFSANATTTTTTNKVF